MIMKKTSKYILTGLLSIASMFVFVGCSDNGTRQNVINNYTITASENMSQIAEKSLPSVVTILSEKDNSGSLGSGVCIKEGSFIATNYHVVESAIRDKAFTISIIHNEKIEDVHIGKVLWFNKETDTAIIKCECNDCPVLEMEDRVIYPVADKKLKVAEDVITIGTPITLGLHNSVTKGVISNKNRNAISHFELGEKNVYENLIQHDSSISGGCSGGPLIDSKGKVIALNTLSGVDVHKIINGEVIADESNDIYYATPIYPIIKVIDNVVASYNNGQRKFIEGKTKIVGTDRFYDPAGRTQKGYFVGAQSSGLVAGDIIIQVKINGKNYEVNQRNDFLFATMNLKPGEQIEIKYIKGINSLNKYLTIIILD